MRKLILLSMILIVINACQKDDSLSDIRDGLPQEFKALANAFDGNGIGAAVNLGKNVIILFNRDGDEYAWFEDGEIKIVMHINATPSLFRKFTLGNVGAADVLEGDKLFLFNRAGTHYSAATFDPNDVKGQFENTELLSFIQDVYEPWQWGIDYTIPFNKIGTIWHRPYRSSQCIDRSHITWMTNDLGDRFTRYATTLIPVANILSYRDQLMEWWCDVDIEPLPFHAVSAACYYISPSDEIWEIFFNTSGTQFCYFQTTELLYSPVYDLY